MGSNRSDTWFETDPVSPILDGDGGAHGGIPLQGTRYARLLQRRQNFSTLNRLYDIGVDADLSLPRICVLGSQSAGKSSLIEAISGVPLPRASGTCTRCPTECILTQSLESPWSCKVSLKFHYDGRNQELVPHRHFEFGPVMRSPAEVKERLRRAQVAILNPDLDSPDFPHRFLEGDLPDRRAASFSHNFISMVVEGPEVVDLSFVDLPGIIAAVSSGSPQSDIDDVKTLAIRYISNESGIVLLAVTCETDFENQGAWQIGKAHDRNAERTIGVLTKPDRIEQGNEVSWFSLLRNEREFLQRGWYCVKLPGPDELRSGISTEDARRNEDSFFAREPWASMNDVQERLSVDNLVEGLADALSDKVSQQLPHIRRHIARKIDEIEQELASLPPDFTDNPIGELFRLLNGFGVKVRSEIEGTINPEGLIQKIKAHQSEFRRELRGTAPRFVPFDKGTSEARHVPFLDFLDEQERDLGKEGTLDIIYLDEVKWRADAAISRELPKNVPFALKREFICRSILKWEAPCRRLFREVQTTVEGHFSMIIHEHFSEFPPLLQAASSMLSERRSACRKKTENNIRWMRKAEEANTFTLSTNYLEDYRLKLEAHYKRLRLWKATSYATAIRMLLDPAGEENSKEITMAEAEEYLPSAPHSRTHYHHLSPPTIELSEWWRRDRLLRALEEFGVPASVDDVIKLLPSDSANGAIEIMADVRAYWQVAFKRFADYIPLAIDMDYIRAFGEGLDEYLLRQLGATSPDAEDRCREYFVQPPHVQARRNALKVKLRRLEDAQAEISAWVAQLH